MKLVASGGTKTLFLPLNHLLVVAVHEVDHQPLDPPSLILRKGFFQLFAERLPVHPETHSNAFLLGVIEDSRQVDVWSRREDVRIGVRRIVETRIALHKPRPVPLHADHRVVRDVVPRTEVDVSLVNGEIGIGRRRRTVLYRAVPPMERRLAGLEPTKILVRRVVEAK